jgi:hypothetical protein
MGLEDLGRERHGELGSPRRLKRAGRDDHLGGLDAAIVELEHESAVILVQRPHPTPELDRERERLCVLLEVGDDLVTGRVAVGLAGESQSREAVVPTRREQDQRIPAAAPSGADRIGAIEDHEPPTLASEEIPHRQARLARPDHRNIEAPGPTGRQLGFIRLFSYGGHVASSTTKLNIIPLS